MTARTLALAALALAAGCGGAEPRTHPASGRVVFADGTAVTSGVVEFAPVGGGPAARGKIGPDGRFELETGGRRGAVAGEHQVAVVQMILTDGHPDHVRKGHQLRLVHGRHRRFETSKLSREVKAGGNEFVLEVESAEVKGKAGWGK